MCSDKGLSVLFQKLLPWPEPLWKLDGLSLKMLEIVAHGFSGVEIGNLFGDHEPVVFIKGDEMLVEGGVLGFCGEAWDSGKFMEPRKTLNDTEREIPNPISNGFRRDWRSWQVHPCAGIASPEVAHAPVSINHPETPIYGQKTTSRD